jgi:hypothetical protein
MQELCVCVCVGVCSDGVESALPEQSPLSSRDIPYALSSPKPEIVNSLLILTRMH